jgi:hypothetical protein
MIATIDDVWVNVVFVLSSRPSGVLVRTRITVNTGRIIDRRDCTATSVSRNTIDLTFVEPDVGRGGTGRIWHSFHRAPRITSHPRRGVTCALFLVLSADTTRTLARV